jgi:hypothetical protein
MKNLAFNKVLKTIKGCITEKQLEVAKRMMDNYYKKTDSAGDYLELNKEYQQKKEELLSDIQIS